MPKISMQKGERLIAEIRANEVLYDSAHKDYSDLALKTKVWGAVAAKCGLRTAHEAKLLWKNLRDCYRICRSKLNVNPKGRMWRFYKQMEFLAPYIKYRKLRGGPANSSSSLLETTIAEKEKEESPPREMSLDINDTNGGFTTVYYWNDGEPKGSAAQVSSNKIEEPRQEELPAEVENRLNSPFDSESCDEVAQGTTSDSSLKMFFDAMCASTSELPLSLQRFVKNKIFVAVIEAEEEAEKLKDSPSTGIRIKLET